ncbi:MAG: hypothetical protein ACE5G2_03570 [Candidatus Krumholzibacteriia bacterium]
MPDAITYTNRVGRKYQLCEVTTKTGKRRYVFSREPTGKPLETIPAGYEISESINGQVSLRKAGASPIQREEIETVESALRCHEHLARYKVGAHRNAVVVFEPDRGVFDVCRELGVGPSDLEGLASRVRYSAVLRFVLVRERPRRFVAERMCYRGSIDGWLSLHDVGSLSKLADRYLPHLGRDSFFELW